MAENNAALTSAAYIVMHALMRKKEDTVVDDTTLQKKLILSAIGLIRPEECPFRCPELNACINASVWCDGVINCPSGYDEALTHCSFLLQLPPVYLCLGTLVILACMGSLFAIVYKRCKRRPRSVLQTRLKSLSSSDTAIIDEKGVTAKVNAVVMRGGRVTMRQIAKEVGITTFSAHSIMTEDLAMKRVTSLNRLYHSLICVVPIALSPIAV
ncbi:uncharacterized protein CBL_20019 [Carabus blaptoides fortunei]